MRNIFSFLTSALVLLAVTVACHPSEITNPDNPDPKGKSEITITASIIQTRVSYDCSGLGEVKQHWEKNDILFGYYHQKDTDPSTSNQIVFQVERVDPGTGIATLKVLSPEDWIDNATDKTVVDLVYTGDVNNLPFSDSGISVDLSGQSLDRVPGCMHAQAALQEDEDGNKSLEFIFQNDCALIEIDSLTGIVESGISGELISVKITNLLLGGSYSFSDGGELVFVSDEESLYEEYTINLSGWTVGNDGVISGPDRKKLLIAVAPNPDENEIDVTAKVSYGPSEPSISYQYGERSLAGGLCYVISAQPVVAKTADGQCFKSVSAAFDHAEALSSQGYNTASKNVVTLIKKEINGFGEQTASQTHMSSIDINSHVTLDLNGCTLSLSGAEGFNVNYIDLITPATFTITDSAPLDKDGKYVGTINSSSINPIIINYGDVIIDGGKLYFTFSDKSYYERYCMIDNAGGSLTIGNDSYLQVDGTTPNNDVMYFLISSTGTLTVNSGSLKANDVLNTIGNLGGTVTIHGGEVYSNGSHAVNSEGGSITIDRLDNTVETSVYSNSYDYPAIYVTADGSNTKFTMKGGAVSGKGNFAEIQNEQHEVTGFTKICGAIELKGDVTGSISGGTITTNGLEDYLGNHAGYALYVHDGSTCTISGGEVTSQSDFLPSVFCYAGAEEADGASLTVSSGTITGYAGGVALEGKVTGTFTGGEVDTFSKDTQNAGCTVLVDNGSVCTISGGKYYNAGKNNPTIRAIGENGAGTKLTIDWPGSDRTVGETKHEPLIYVSSTNQTCVDALDYHGGDGYATVKLLGGYFFININNQITYSFYKGSRTSILEDFGYIYTNQTRITDGETYNIMSSATNYYVNDKRIMAVKEGTSGISFKCQIGGGADKTIKVTYHVAPEGQ